MKPELVTGFIAAVILHGLVLFGFSLATPARPLAMSDEPSPVDVSLVAAPPEPAAAAAAAPPEPAAAAAAAPPEPTPEPAATPEPTPDMPTPPPEPTPEQETMPAPESTPVPQHPKPMPRHHEQQRPNTAVPHTAPGAAAALAGAASHGATSGQRSTRASYLSNPKPDYPEEARQQKQQGVVLVNVEVGTDGRPSDVGLSRTSGFPLLDQAAIQAVRRWRFEPAEAAGLPVASRVEVPVRFSLSR